MASLSPFCLITQPQTRGCGYRFLSSDSTAADATAQVMCKRPAEHRGNAEGVPAGENERSPSAVAVSAVLSARCGQRPANGATQLSREPLRPTGPIIARFTPVLFSSAQLNLAPGFRQRRPLQLTATETSWDPIGTRAARRIGSSPSPASSQWPVILRTRYPAAAPYCSVAPSRSEYQMKRSIRQSISAAVSDRGI